MGRSVRSLAKARSLSVGSTIREKGMRKLTIQSSKKMTSDSLPEFSEPDIEAIFQEWQNSGDSTAQSATNMNTDISRQTTNSQARNWCFTLNTPTEDELNNLHVTLPRSPEFRYMVFQLEAGSQNTEHCQGYIEFNTQMRFNRVKSLISPRVHLETRRGTRLQAIAYCKKEDSRTDGPWEYGQGPSQGARSDLDLIREAVMGGSTLRELYDNHFSSMIRYGKGVERYRALVSEKRNFQTQVFVCVGPTGTGKSKWCNESYPGAYWKSRGNWWDGFDGNDTVVVDEFYGWLPFDTVLRLCDRYPLMVETKGGHINFNAKLIVFTSNKEPDQWYPNVSNFDAFIRRVTTWYRFDNYGQHSFSNYNAFKNYS